MRKEGASTCDLALSRNVWLTDRQTDTMTVCFGKTILNNKRPLVWLPAQAVMLGCTTCHTAAPSHLIYIYRQINVCNTDSGSGAEDGCFDLLMVFCGFKGCLAVRYLNDKLHINALRTVGTKIKLKFVTSHLQAKFLHHM